MHLLTTDEMAQADRNAMAGGIAGTMLMRNAAEAVAAIVTKIAKPDDRIRILCGPGNNGGDGYVTGAILAEGWYDTTIHAAESPKAGTEAAWASNVWGRQVHPLEDFNPRPGEVVIDALFGAGLSRELEGVYAETVERANNSGVLIVAVDMPSGISGDTGRMHGNAIKAAHTVSFFRGKPGHWLYPGRGHCGELHIADIGIGGAVLEQIAPRHLLNGPSLWRHRLPRPPSDTHKYARGAVAVLSGDALSTGASRLSAKAAARAGAGAVTLIAPPDAARVHAFHLTAIMIDEATDGESIAERVLHGKERAVVIGPGFGVGERLRAIVLRLLQSPRDSGRLKTMVLDADALTSFSEHSEELFAAMKQSRLGVILTPHAGEFHRLFPDLAESGLSKTKQASEAAARSGATVLLKGADTVIGEPHGRIAINPNGTPLLATAGSGDVLAGLIAGLAAQGMPIFEAACAASWIHAESARSFGPGLIADDLPDMIPAVLSWLMEA